MILQEIFIDGFGIYNNFYLSGLKPGLNIITGDNEAGKSTLQKFIRYTLFGYPRLTDERMPPLNGGSHGGKIRCLLASGEEVLFQRKPGNKAGEIELQFRGKVISDKDQWSQLLGNATPNLYNNIYAFSLDELVALKSLSESGMEDKIFSVGLGLGNISIGDLELKLGNQANAIYSSGGRTHKMAHLIKEFQTKKAEVQEIQNDLPKYEILNNDLSALKNDSEQIVHSRDEYRNQLSQLKIYTSCHDSFIEAESYKSELAGLPAKQDYPEEAPAKMDKLVAIEESLNEKLSTLRQGNVREKGLADLVQEHDEILVDNELLKLENKLAGLVNNLAKYNQTRADTAEDNARIEALTASVNRELEQINTSWTIRELREFGNTILYRGNLSVLKESRDELMKKRTRLEAEESILISGQSQINMSAIVNALCLILIVLAGASIFYKIYIVAAVCLLIAAIIYFKKGSYKAADNPLAVVKQKINELRDVEEPRWNTDYRNFLETVLHLKGEYSLDAVLNVFNAIDRAKREISDLDDLQKKQKEERNPFIVGFEEAVGSFKKYTEESEMHNGIVEVVHHLKNKLEINKQNAAEKQRLEEQYRSREKEIEFSSTKLSETTDEMKALLESVNAGSVEEFRKKYFENGQIKRLTHSLNLAVQSIERNAGRNKYQAVSDYFSEHDLAEINGTTVNLEHIIADLDKKIREKDFTMGEKTTERDRIAGESTLTARLTEIEMIREKMNLEYKNWTVSRMALQILEEIKMKYEREKQPAVIKNSIRYFSKITGEKYNRILVSLTDNKVTVFDKRESPKKIDQLSRGTKEQLLISLRLGLIEQYESLTEPLPIIADEILVNFDPVRLKKSATVLHEFSANRQILLFTCNPATKDYFEGMEVNTIQIQ
jgi:uncharacterized protein YhaN